jgi:ketosteroid isomerase-like protein
MVTTITDSKTRAIVRELYDAYERRDFERVAKLIHDDIDWIIYGPITVFPFAGARHGRTAVLQVLTEIANVYHLESYTPETVIIEDERAAVVSDVSFRQRATGRVLRFRVANFMRLKNGLLIEFREFTNSFDVVEQALGRELKT